MVGEVVGDVCQERGMVCIVVVVARRVCAGEQDEGQEIRKGGSSG